MPKAKDLMEGLADAVEDGVLDAAAAGLIELEGRIEEELVGQLLVREPAVLGCQL